MPTNPAIAQSQLALEEDLEESSVTELRNGLLPTIERIQQNPALRVLIRKHGRPRAVLMSVQTYNSLKRLVSVLDHAEASRSREERIEAAIQRVQAETLEQSATAVEAQIAADESPVEIAVRPRHRLLNAVR
ncbi:MAG TPA: type II toxin-antitoxin system Phd/YefM family antitoxin [Acidisarcina sp.]